MTQSIMKRQNFPESAESRATRGLWLNAEIELARASREWLMVLDCKLDAAELTARCLELDGDPKKGKAAIKAAISDNDRELHNLLAQADAFQSSEDQMNHLHHTANVLFNSMRGGVFLNHYAIEGEALQAHIKAANPALYNSHREDLQALNGWLAYASCRKQIEAIGDLDLLRYFLEYLPITFSRRHGDPSRPWNKFMIRT